MYWWPQFLSVRKISFAPTAAMIVIILAKTSLNAVICGALAKIFFDIFWIYPCSCRDGLINLPSTKKNIQSSQNIQVSQLKKPTKIQRVRPVPIVSVASKEDKSLKRLHAAHEHAQAVNNFCLSNGQQRLTEGSPIASKRKRCPSIEYGTNFTDLKDPTTPCTDVLDSVTGDHPKSVNPLSGHQVFSSLDDGNEKMAILGNKLTESMKPPVREHRRKRPKHDTSMSVGITKL